jgi:hypothetical protein
VFPQPSSLCGASNLRHGHSRNLDAASEFVNKQGDEAQMLRSVLAELFPNWMKRHAIREQRSTSRGSISALASLQRKIKMADKQKPAVKNPGAPGQRSAKADPDLKETTSGALLLVTREDPAPHPNGGPKGNAGPRPSKPDDSA